MSENPDNPNLMPDAPVTEDSGTRALSDALKSSFRIVQVVMVILLAVFLSSGFFTVEKSQRKIVLRLGRPVGEGKEALLGPGLHWAFPRPIDEVRTIPYTEIQTVKSSVGWYFTTPENEAISQMMPPGATLNPAVDGYTITGDGNIIHTRATLSYQIDDPVRYEFEFMNASNSIRNALDNALIYASARSEVDDILRRNPLGFKEMVQNKVNELVHEERLGIVIVGCVVESMPPRRLIPAFESLNNAASAAEKQQLEAQSAQNIITNGAIAEANRRTNSAVVDRERLVQSVRADAERFNALRSQYELDPAFFKAMLLNEVVSQYMTNVQGQWYLPVSPSGEPWEVRFQMNQPPRLKPPSQSGQ